MEAFWSGWWWPALTAILGLVFTALIFAQWLHRRKPHQLAWSVGMLFYGVAAVMESVSEYTGYWNPGVYRVYIVLAASLVGFLGLGSYYLVAKKKLGPNIYLGFLSVCLVIFFYGTFTVQLQMDKLIPGITVGGQALGDPLSFPRIMSLPFNITGSFFLIGASLLSIFRFARKPEFRYRVWANVLIIVGTLVIAWAGSMARAGTTVGLYPAEMVASAILLAGFLMAGTLEKGSREAAAHARERREHEAAAHAAEIERPPDL
ncbi:MAG: hypothetical protein P4L93_12320 [Coriobacteriia bacterium]|nr:hypothetical protein [Coriobacteriia bacterium]